MIGVRAEQVCRAARRLAIHHIVMGTARKNSITRMLEDSMTHRLLETTPVPVEVIAGDAVSKWERWALPAGVVGLGGLLVLAVDLSARQRLADRTQVAWYASLTEIGPNPSASCGR